MESPKKPLKKTGTTKKPAAKKTDDKVPVSKPKSSFLDEEEDEEFDTPIDDLGAYDHFEGLEDHDDDY